MTSAAILSDDDLLTLPAAAQWMRERKLRPCSRNRLELAVVRGDLPSRRLSSGITFVTTRDLQAFAERKKSPAPEPQG